MNKKYLLLSLVGIFLFSSQSFSQTLALSLNAENGTEKLEGEHGDFTISSTLSRLPGESVCFSEGMGSDLWQFSTATQELIIRNNGSDDILRIDLEGILYNGAGGSSVLMICSRRMNDGNDGQLTPVSNSFTTSSGSCVVYEFNTPLESGGVTSYPRHFVFSPLSVSNGFPCIQRISIYTNRMPTSLDEIPSGSLSWQRIGDDIVFDEDVQSVTLYTISGSQVYHQSSFKSFSFNSFPSGIYIMKAIGNEKQSVVVKLVK